MIEPPIFRPSFGNRPDDPVGREPTISTLARCFDSYKGMRERAILITGQRGMEKTALLLEASDLASSRDFVVVRTTFGNAPLNNIIDGLHLLQLIGYYLVSLTSEDELITPEVLERARALAQADLNDNVFLPTLRPLSRTDAAFLEAMAADDGPSRVANIQKRLDVSQGSVQSYRKRLLDAGVVVSPRRGELSFVVPALADYLRSSAA